MDTYEVVCGTHPGRIRSGNEDAVFGDEALGLAVLADGMGGYAAGEVASRIAIDEVTAHLLPTLRQHGEEGLMIPSGTLREEMRFAAGGANTAIIEQASREPDYEGMGSTLVMAVLQPGSISVAHLGDSRAYRWRAGQLEQLTRDHSWMDEQLAQGSLSVDTLLNSKFKNIVTRALGIEDEIDLEVHEHDALEGDVYLLCSDGLSDMLENAEIAAILSGEGTLGDKVQQLIDAANENGGRDNVSVILLRQAPPPPQGWAQRLMRRLQGEG